MMKIVKILLVFAAFCLLFSCRQGYKIENDKVYYEYWNEAVGHGKLLMPSANAKTFESIGFKCDCNFNFGKDKNHLFIDGVPVKNIDPHSFKFLGNYVFADKDSAYFFGFYNDINNCAIKGIDLKRLQLIKYPWSKAGDILIHGYDTIKLSDISDFEPIDKDWGRTKSKVIQENTILKGADPNTFEIINSYSGRDKRHTYEFGKIKQ
ncbi:DKNYY domain-containing protein [Mucilaginibacter sp. ZT4R22]|uniref:DKNYY domain-containing protein n=1 Tax=Mucilaginibacter pankratovii TaxID=2772110 RepID=A0ABR7WRH5_9SPHI|nr:DKNYY domain-containing protein [Mucilaginibacter pankratovii]MBD1364836.1 DKNYY domain-containing protein [Mucilaginibacter pankratovii]